MKRLLFIGILILFGCEKEKEQNTTFYVVNNTSNYVYVYYVYGNIDTELLVDFLNFKSNPSVYDTLWKNYWMTNFVQAYETTKYELRDKDEEKLDIMNTILIETNDFNGNSCRGYVLHFNYYGKNITINIYPSEPDIVGCRVVANCVRGKP